MQHYVSVTIHLLRFRLTNMSQDSGAGKVGHRSFRVYWSLRSVCSRFKARSGKFLCERFRCKLKVILRLDPFSVRKGICSFLDIGRIFVICCLLHEKRVSFQFASFVGPFSVTDATNETH